MEVSSGCVPLGAGEPMGGYAGRRLSAAASSALEINTWAFVDSSTGRKHEVCAIDALYAGELARTWSPPDRQRHFAASHTHCAPMLDAGKPQIGALAEDAVLAYAAVLNEGARKPVRPDVCRIHATDVGVPIYRRFDTPDSAANRWLTAHAGMYPNARQPIDSRLHLFEFAQGDETLFTLVHHACHPVTRGNSDEFSADYVAAIRQAVRARFGARPCLFLLGCAGDIRPNFAHKRIGWLPRSRLNWRFEWPPSPSSIEMADRQYAQAVERARLVRALALTADGAVQVQGRSLQLRGPGRVDTFSLVVGGQLRLEFVPFEVSHLFHLDAQAKDPMHFIVSCADQTLGYLPHPRQFRAGGYEVDGSRPCMGLDQRVEAIGGALW